MSLFNEIFSQERSLKELTAQYTSNPYLNSYHVLSIENTRIVGHFAFVPSDYLVDGKREKFVVGIDSFVVDGFRDGMVLLESYLCALDNFKQRGVSIILGFPDTHVNKVYSKGKLYSNIGQLNIYILPYRVGGIYKKLKYFNLLSAALSMLPSTVGSLIASREVATYRIQKEPLSFNSERYSYGKSNYGRVNIKDFEFMFRIKLHEGIRTLFLIDVSIKSARNFNLVVRYLIKLDLSL